MYFLGILAITAFAGWVYTDELIHKGATLWDNTGFYSFFWNQLDSLHRFGEPAWWFPGSQYGTPAYYYSILGDINASSPAFMVIGFVSWLSGRFGFSISYYGLFTFYYAFLIPLLANLAAYCVLTQLLRNRWAIAFGVSLMAFSPGVLLNISDPGFLEPAAYGLFFIAGWMRFVESPGLPRFWQLLLAAAVLALTMGYPHLVWNVIFLPLSMVLITTLSPHGWDKVKAAFRALPPRYFGAAAGVLLISALTPLLTLSQTGDLVRYSTGGGAYNIRDLLAGFPAEMLAVSLPQFGFNWDGNGYALLAAGKKTWASIHYLCLLALPLSIAGLVYGGRILRLGVFIALLAMAAVVSLSAWSPVFKPVINAVGVLQANNHWSDLAFRAGGYLIFVLLASMGFQLICDGHRRAVRVLPWLIGGNLALTAAVFAAYEPAEMMGNPAFGLAVVLSGLFVVINIWLRGARRQRRGLLMLLIFMTAVDMSTFAFLHMRKTVNNVPSRAFSRPDKLMEDNVGLDTGNDWGRFDFAEKLISFKAYRDLHLAGQLEQPIPRFQLFRPGGNQKLEGKVEIVSQSYNDLNLRVTSPEAAALFVRDGYSPYWKIKVAGASVPFEKADGIFKLFAVPAGTSEIHMRFSPPAVGWALLLAYTQLLALAVLAFSSARNQESRPPSRRRSEPKSRR